MVSRSSVIERLRSRCEHVVGPGRALTGETSRTLYSYDAYLVSAMPELVVSVTRPEQVSAVVAHAHRLGVPFVARGAGTGYAGGSVPVAGGLVISLTELRRIVELDQDAGWARVEPGVVTADLAAEAAAVGWRYIPDPSSHTVCTIGGNVATNAGGPHCLRYGVTSRYVLDVDFVTARGDEIRLGDLDGPTGHLDLRGLVVGSEGTLGIIVGARLRLSRPPESVRTVLAAFADTFRALALIDDLFQRGLVPAALDMSCRLVGAGGERPIDDRTILFIDLEGFVEEVEDQLALLQRRIEHHGGTAESLSRSALMSRRAEIARERIRQVTEITGGLRYFLFDAVVPRSRLAAALEAIEEGARAYRFPVLNTFHAGDGNIHPTLVYDPGEPDVEGRMHAFWNLVLARCRELEGELSGEHGIGLEKRDVLPDFLPPATLQAFHRIKRAFDPQGLVNPHKMLPPADRAAPPSRSRRRRGSQRPRTIELAVADGYIRLPPRATVGEVGSALAATPYEIAYVPLGGGTETAVVEALDEGRPGLADWLYGPIRDRVLGATLERSSHRLEVGSALAKTVSGYDLRKLVFGARGALGGIAELTLKVVPRAEHCWAGEAIVPSLEAADTLVRRWSRRMLPWAYLGIAGGDYLPLRVVLGLAGPKRRVEAARRDLSSETSGLRASDAMPWPTAARDGTLWRAGDLGDHRLARLRQLSERRIPWFLTLTGIDLLVWGDGREHAPGPAPEPIRRLEVAAVEAFAHG